MIRFQLRLKGQIGISRDIPDVEWPALPSIGDTIHYDLGHAGTVFWVEAVDHFINQPGESQPEEHLILVVASHRIVRVGEKEPPR